MLYKDIVHFEALEDIIQLREADEKTTAQHFVETYVISNRMADQLINLVIPNLQIDKLHNNKGVLIVGNYGTGKSHLMAMLSSIAEHADLAGKLKNPAVREAAGQIAGKFKVWRAEIGGVTGSLRDILIRELEEALEAWGTPFAFPPADQLTNHKDAIIDAVHALQQKFPDQGLLLVVDELLDYLRMREERSLILDLGFLRELGEVAALTPFRFLAGVQETLFDNPRFSFVAEPLRRVRDRFEQVRIAREDIAYVVSERLLKKSDVQLAKIVDHLRPFTSLYHGMAERLEEYARLFPIHPAYIETFERVYVAEKREVLKTFSLAVRTLLEQTVPTDQPGLVSYDHYWNILRENPSMRGLPGVAEVIEKSNILEGRIDNAFSRKHLLPMARRIIHALSVHRLTTDDIYKPLGATPEELRDTLMLFTNMPSPSTEMLLDMVQVTLKEIMRTVSGQYLSVNEANGQYYLDVKKDIDFDAKIQERGDFMEDTDLNRFFFDALRQVLGLSDSTYVTGYRIWSDQLPWAARKVTRPGYLFFGAPNERSTAQPPRDFYIYLLPPFSPTKFDDEKKPDEVIFEFAGIGQDFKQIIERYAGARALSQEAASHREVYADKADETLRRRLLPWMREHFPSHLQVTHQGVREPLRNVLTKLRSSANQSLQELLHQVSAHLLEGAFADKYPQYPAFERVSQPISEEGRPTAAMEAVRLIARGTRTQLGIAVMEGLKLLDAEGNIRPYESPFARKYLDLLQKKPDAQVVNHGEVIEQVSGGLTPVYKDIHFKLEPEWTVVVLLALVYNGDILLNVNGRDTLDAGSLETVATRALADLVDFRHFGRPREIPISLWVMIFEGLGLSPALIRSEDERKGGVERLGEVVQAEIKNTAELQGKLQSGLRLWNTPVFTDTLIIVEKGTVVPGSSTQASDKPGVTFSVNELTPRLRGYKKLLEELTRFNTVGKLRNLRLTVTEVADALEDRKAVQRGEKLLNLVNGLQEITAYLAVAQTTLPEDHAWSQQAASAKTNLLEDVRRLGKGDPARTELDIRRELEGLKKAYILAYAERHRALVLGSHADEHRQRLYRAPELGALKTLATVDLLRQTSDELRAWEQMITSLPICREFHEGALTDTPICPFCHLVPSQRREDTPSETLLTQLETRLNDMLLRWQQALRDALNSESAKRSIEAMTPQERAPIEGFLTQPDNSTAIPKEFVGSANRALRGIEAISLPVEALIEVLKAGGLPCTLEELQSRFSGFVREAMRGHDMRNTRLTLEE